MNYLIPLIVYIAVNIAAFAVYVYDKRQAVKQKWRVPESTLIGIAVFGPVGATLGMLIANHKTRKLKFKIVYVLLLIHIILIAVMISKGILTF